MSNKRKAEQQPAAKQPVSKDSQPKSDASLTGQPTGAVVFPGDVLHLRGSVVRLGAGLLAGEGHKVVASRVGFVKQGANSKLSIDNAQKRYIPAAEDLVIGTVVERHVESYKLDIGGPELATLPALSFEGATKRNKPNLALHSLVYCRVLHVYRDMEPELTCISPHIKHQWVTQQAYFGPLTAGTSCTVSLQAARRLLEADEGVLEMCGERVEYEVAVGMNGRVWVGCDNALATVLIVNAIVNAQHMNVQQTRDMVKQLFAIMQ